MNPSKKSVGKTYIQDVGLVVLAPSAQLVELFVDGKEMLRDGRPPLLQPEAHNVALRVGGPARVWLEHADFLRRLRKSRVR